MPPKRKGVPLKAELQSGGLDLPSEGQLQPSAPKSVKKEKIIYGKDEIEEKNISKKSTTSKGGVKEKVESNRSTRGKNKSDLKVEANSPKVDNKVVRKAKKEADVNGISEVKMTRQKKRPREEPKIKEKVLKEKANKPNSINNTITNWEMISYMCTKKNKEGQKPNLKISCWNIGGIKSWLKKDCLKFLEYENPDILCIQETKCSEKKLPEEMKILKDFKQFWCSSTKEGYAGVGLLTKQEPLGVNYGIDVPELDEDGRCITAEYKEYYIICVYVPNAGRKLITLPKRLEWNKAFEDYVNSLDNKKPVIICGDMNVAHTEIDLARPANNIKNAGFTKEEREGMTDFLANGYVDAFRKLYPDKTDIYTFWTYMANARAKNIGWRLDYFIVSERIMDKICDVTTRSEVYGSDHCPITLFINI